MSFSTNLSPGQSLNVRFEEAAVLTAAALVFAYLVLLAASYQAGIWLTDADGKIRQSDFVAVWAAGRLVLEGHAANVHDWPIHKAVEELALGHRFDKYFSWNYPPTFLPVAAFLALLPYLVAYFVWPALTLPAYMAVIRSIIDRPAGILLACAFPASLWNVSVGQNGFLTAALFGGALVALEKRPALAGILLGLLTYKPQIGILFPLLLVVGGYWRVFAVATLTTLILIGSSWALFGTATWLAFFERLELTHTLVLNGGLAGFQKMQTMIGLVRSSGGSDTLAWMLQGSAAALSAVFVIVVWTRPVAYELKAAAVGIAALVATPYLYVYDLVVLAVPLAFLVRLGLQTKFLPYEIPTIAAVSALVFLIPLIEIPLTPVALAALGGVILRRILLRNPHVNSKLTK